MVGALFIVAAAVGAPALSSYPDAARSGDTLTIPVGTTAKVTLRVPIVGEPTRFAQVLIRSAGWTGVADVLEMGEIVRTRDEPSSAEVALLISVNAASSKPLKGAMRVLVSDPNIGRTVGEITWRPRLVAPRSADESPVASATAELKDARDELNTALAEVGSSASAVRRTGMARLRPDTAQRLQAMIDATRALGRVQAAGAQLRSVGLRSDHPQAAAAARALAAHRGPARRPSERVLEKTPTDRAITRVEALLTRLQLERAVGWVDALIDSNRLERAQLAQALVLRATALGLGGFEAEARTGFGQGTCLDATARPPARPVFQGVFETLALPPPCATPLAARGVSGSRAATPTGVVLTVQVAYGPDPFNLVAGGSVQLYDARGQLLARQAGVPEPVGDQTALVAEFIDDGTLADPTGQIYVSASLDGPGRVLVAEAGATKPVAVPVETVSSYASGGIPLWVWITLGVAAVGGATAAAVVVATSGDDTDVGRGIGPIDIRF